MNMSLGMTAFGALSSSIEQLGETVDELEQALCTRGRDREAATVLRELRAQLSDLLNDAELWKSFLQTEPDDDDDDDDGDDDDRDEHLYRDIKNALDKIGNNATDIRDQWVIVGDRLRQLDGVAAQSNPENHVSEPEKSGPLGEKAEQAASHDTATSSHHGG
jgi:hypothetical protein